MNQDLQFIFQSLDEICSNCESPNACSDCLYAQMRNSANALTDALNGISTTQTGCHICRDKKGNKREISYFDVANNLRFATYCPECGAKL